LLRIPLDPIKLQKTLDTHRYNHVSMRYLKPRSEDLEKGVDKNLKTFKISDYIVENFAESKIMRIFAVP